MSSYGARPLRSALRGGRQGAPINRGRHIGFSDGTNPGTDDGFTDDGSSNNAFSHLYNSTNSDPNSMQSNQSGPYGGGPPPPSSYYNNSHYGNNPYPNTNSYTNTNPYPNTNTNTNTGYSSHPLQRSMADWNTRNPAPYPHGSLYDSRPPSSFAPQRPNTFMPPPSGPPQPMNSSDAYTQYATRTVTEPDGGATITNTVSEVPGSLADTLQSLGANIPPPPKPPKKGFVSRLGSIINPFSSSSKPTTTAYEDLLRKSREEEARWRNEATVPFKNVDALHQDNARLRAMIDSNNGYSGYQPSTAPYTSQGAYPNPQSSDQRTYSNPSFNNSNGSVDSGYQSQDSWQPSGSYQPNPSSQYGSGPPGPQSQDGIPGFTIETTADGGIKTTHQVSQLRDNVMYRHSVMDPRDGVTELTFSVMAVPHAGPTEIIAMRNGFEQPTNQSGYSTPYGTPYGTTSNAQEFARQRSLTRLDSGERSQVFDTWDRYQRSANQTFSLDDRLAIMERLFDAQGGDLRSLDTMDNDLDVPTANELARLRGAWNDTFTQFEFHNNRERDLMGSMAAQLSHEGWRPNEVGTAIRDIATRRGNKYTAVTASGRDDYSGMDAETRRRAIAKKRNEEYISTLTDEDKTRLLEWDNVNLDRNHAFHTGGEKSWDAWKDMTVNGETFLSGATGPEDAEAILGREKIRQDIRTRIESSRIIPERTEHEQKLKSAFINYAATMELLQDPTNQTLRFAQRMMEDNMMDKLHWVRKDEQRSGIGSYFPRWMTG